MNHKHHNKDIVMKPANKISAVVIMQGEFYLKEGYRQLSDINFNRKLEHDATAEFNPKISNFLENMYHNGYIDPSVQQYLLEDTQHTS